MPGILRGGPHMDKSNQSRLLYPHVHCKFCSAKTPHVHERVAIDGKQVVRSLCLMCRREQSKATGEIRWSLPRASS